MKDNFPAFPNVETAFVAPHSGMTLRDYFAAKAMSGCLDENITPNMFDHIATWSYQMADAMMEARK